MTSEYSYKDFDAPPVRSFTGGPNQPLGPTTSNSINRGLAAMPAQERSIPIDQRAHDGAKFEIGKRAAGERLQLIGGVADRGYEHQTGENEPGHDHPHRT